MGKDISLVALTIDPETDTPDQLEWYAESYGNLPGWTYLTGDYDEIEEIRYAMGVYDPDPIVDQDKASHAGLITFGNDKLNRWAALPGMMRADQIVETVERITRHRIYLERKPKGEEQEPTEAESDAATSE